MVLNGRGHLRVLWLLVSVPAWCPSGSWAQDAQDAKSSVAASSSIGSEKDPLLDMIMYAPPIKIFDKFIDDDGQELYRKHTPLGTIPDNNWHGVPSYKINKFSSNFKAEMDQKNGTFFRTSKKARGSKKNVNFKVKPWPHEPSKHETQGCGNPICVIIDRKPRRFRDLCQFKNFLENENRGRQVNYVQKGDCYQIIDKKEGAENLPWHTKGSIQDNCASCQKDPNCHGNVILNIDIANIFLGYSSAYGGPKFHEHERTSKRMSGLPIEFPCICDAMKFMESYENINIKTQVIGVGFGSVADYFPVEGENCLWTEWFDHDTPCNSDEDLENHNDHKVYLDSTYTAPLRICLPENIHQTQHIGGSEMTRVESEDAIKGNALGVDCCEVAKGIPLKFGQEITTSKLQVKCRNKDQKIKQLPPPFIYNDDKNNTCLDWKARYCCRSQAMYRATPIDSVLGRFTVTFLPAGAAYATYSLNSKGDINSVIVKIGYGKKGENIVTIDISQHGNKYVAKYHEGGSQSQFVVEEKITRTSGGVMKALFMLDHSGKGGPVRVGEIEVTIDPRVNPKYALSVTIKSSNTLTSETVLEGKSEQGEHGKEQGGSRDYPESSYGVSTLKTTIVGPNGGKQTIELMLRGGGILVLQKQEGVVTIPEDAMKGNVYEKLEKFCKTYNVHVLIESPPLSTLFAECDWKDYINLDYPNKREGLNGEYELRFEASEDQKYTQHACGKTPEDAHYVDAITLEDQVPWAELKMGNARYETFKLTPFFGYACKDANGRPEFCLDMKVRYCCAKEIRAQWGDWSGWSECSAECGGGVRIRKRECKQSSLATNSKNYNPVCLGMEDWQSDCTKKRFTHQESECAVENCAVDYKWGHWCVWSQCSISCGQGTKTRKRLCVPAEGGGKDCPDWQTHKELFWETKPCAEKDCERFGETLWSSWTGCSVTCGVGQAQRTRGCMSTLTLKTVPNKNCANEPKHFMQTKKCQLQACPVDGGWSNWSIWSMCNQACVHYPDQGTTITDSAAYRHRKRYCSNPIPSFGGKDCVQDKNFQYISDEKAEEDRTDCITEKNVPSGYKGKIVPWCPEHCIYSLWGEWSHCSFTCVNINLKNIKLSPLDGYEEAQNTNSLQNIEYQFTHASYTLPKRTRCRVLVKEERFGGKCPEKDANYDTPSSKKGTVIMQHEDCSLCKEHCPKSLGNPLDVNSIRDYPKIDYPGKDPKCVGYCPISCEMCGWERSKDCTENMEKEKAKNKKKYPDQPELHNCWVSKSIMVAAEKKQVKVIDDLMKAFTDLGKDIQALKTSTTADDLVYDNEKADELSAARGVPSLEALKKDNKEVFNAIRRELREDVENYISLMENVENRKVREPILEGLFGGHHCKLRSDGKEKIVYSGPHLPKGGSKETHTYNVREGSSAFPCIPQPCKPKVETTDGGTSMTGCDIAMWAPWKPWGKCSEKCGDKGTRPRMRDCMAVCKNEKVDDKLCYPYIDSVSGKKWTSSYTGPCTPCPEEVVGTWGEWSQWTSDQEFKCSPGGKDSYNLVRKRQCIAGSTERTCKEYKGATEGVVTEKMKLPAGKCPENENYWTDKDDNKHKEDDQKHQDDKKHKEDEQKHQYDNKHHKDDEQKHLDLSK